MRTRIMTTGSRRCFLRRAGLSGLAVTVVPSVMAPSRALMPAPSEGTEPASGDPALAAFAESIELALVAAYDVMLSSGKVTTPAAVDAVTAFAMHHAEHAKAFGAAAADAATGVPNPGLVDDVDGEIESGADEAAVLEIAYDLENSAASTHLFALGVLESSEALQLSASVLPVETQHAVVLGTLLEKPPTENVPDFENTDRALRPDRFPTE